MVFDGPWTVDGKAGHRPELAWAWRNSADTLREKSGPGDYDRVVFLPDESLALFSEMGMRPLYGGGAV